MFFMMLGAAIYFQYDTARVTYLFYTTTD